MNQPEKLVVFFAAPSWPSRWRGRGVDRQRARSAVDGPSGVAAAGDQRAGADRQEVPWWRAGGLASVVHIKIDGIYGSSH